MNAVFKMIYDKHVDEFATYLDVRVNDDLITMTPGNNLLYYEKESKTLVLWSMDHKRIIHTEKTK